MASKESFKFDKFLVVDNEDTSTSVDLRSGVAEITYRESIFLPYIVVEAKIADTGNSVTVDGRVMSTLEGIKCQGLEKIEVKITDTTEEENIIDFTGDNALRLSGTTEINTSFKTDTFHLSAVANEAFDNLLLETECRELYTGKISEVVKKIVANNLGSTKNFNHIDITENSISQQGFSRKPFDMILDLQKLSIPQGILTDDGKSSRGNMAGYLFWMSHDGYYYKSLDNLFSYGGSYLNYYDNKGAKIKNYIETKRGDAKIPPGFDDNILYYRTYRTMDALRQFEEGAFGTLLETWDPLTNTFTKTNEVTTDKDGNGVRAGKSLPNLGDYASKPTVRLTQSKLKGQTVLRGDSVTQQVAKTEAENYSVDDVTQQSLQNYKQKMNMSAEIIIPGDFSLHAGDIIYCEFPQTSLDKTVRRSTNRNSGIYMIADLCHFGNRSKTFTGLHLVRDSYGVKSNG